MKTTVKKQSYLEQMGLEPVAKLTKKVCDERVRHLGKGIKSGKYKGELLVQAKYYKNWYAWAKENRVVTSKKKAA